MAIKLAAFGLAEDAEICPACFALRGLMILNDRPPTARQLCDCEIAELIARGEEVPRYGHDLHIVAELCRCCGLELLSSGSRWSKWFCKQRLESVRHLNESFGACMIPIGWHSLMNGTFLRADRARGQAAQIAFFDQLTAFFGQADKVKSWGRDVTSENIAAVGLEKWDPIPLRAYLRKVRESKVLSEEAAFRNLGGADRAALLNVKELQHNEAAEHRRH